MASPVALLYRSWWARWEGIGLPTRKCLRAPTAKPGTTTPSSGLRGELTGSGLDCPTGERSPDAPREGFRPPVVPPLRPGTDSAGEVLATPSGAVNPGRASRGGA